MLVQAVVGTSPYGGRTVYIAVHVVATQVTGEAAACAMLTTAPGVTTGSDTMKVSVIDVPTVAGLVGDDKCTSTIRGGVLSTVTAEPSVVASAIPVCPNTRSYTAMKSTARRSRPAGR